MVVVEQGPHRSGFPSTPVPVKQHMVGVLAVEKAEGVVQQLLLLGLVLLQSGEGGGVELLHRHNLSLFQSKGVIFAVHPHPVFGVVVGKGSQMLPPPLQGLVPAVLRAELRQSADELLLSREGLAQKLLHLTGLEPAQLPAGVQIVGRRLL